MSSTENVPEPPAKVHECVGGADTGQLMTVLGDPSPQLTVSLWEVLSTSVNVPLTVAESFSLMLAGAMVAGPILPGASLTAVTVTVTCPIGQRPVAHRVVEARRRRRSPPPACT